jgi:hypothetical protein
MAMGGAGMHKIIFTRVIALGAFLPVLGTGGRFCRRG